MGMSEWGIDELENLLSSREALIDHNRELIAERRALLDKVARVEALADEWLRNDRDADPWYWSDAGEELRAALDSPADPADIQPDEADIAHRAAMHD
jgi:hypothetical protein